MTGLPEEVPELQPPPGRGDLGLGSVSSIPTSERSARTEPSAVNAPDAACCCSEAAADCWEGGIAMTVIHHEPQ